MAASSDPLLVLHISQLDCFLLRGRRRRLIMTANRQLIDNHSRHCPKERSDNWNPPPVGGLTNPGKQKERAQDKNCSLSTRIFALGSGAMQDLTLCRHHNPLAQDSSTCASAGLPRQKLLHTITQTLSPSDKQFRTATFRISKTISLPRKERSICCAYTRHLQFPPTACRKATLDNIVSKNNKHFSFSTI